MSAWVILRGVFGQFMRPLLRGQARAMVVGVFVSIGLLEGFGRWRLFESRSVHPPLKPGISSS
jgi:hypothetical protein